MNATERRMLEVVRKGRDEFAFDGLKAEFEAEGTRTDELLRLLEIGRRAGLKMALKIGGCEAVRDLYECKQFGVDYIIAPMIETPYALSKYIDAKNKVYKSDERQDVTFLFNVETESTYKNIDAIVDTASKEGGVDGVVFGRVDFTGSLGLGRDQIDQDTITDYVVAVAERSSKAGLELVTGGGVTLNAVDALQKIRRVKLNRFETRKIIFDASVLDGEKIEAALLLAIEFELLWLINKRDYYAEISVEDQKRIDMLQSRVGSSTGTVSALRRA